MTQTKKQSTEAAVREIRRKTRLILCPILPYHEWLRRHEKGEKTQQLRDVLIKRTHKVGFW
jgi:hypothetical protein